MSDYEFIFRNKSFQKIKLNVGQSIHIPTYLVHKFQASKNNKKPIIVGEVSSINDDNNDNFFPDKYLRFTKIIEDEKIQIPTWKDLKKNN